MTQLIETKIKYASPLMVKRISWSETGTILAMSLLIGLLTGVGVLVFFRAVLWCRAFFLANWAGDYAPATAASGATVLLPIAHLWAIPCIMTLGGLLTGLLAHYFTKDAPGHSLNYILHADRHRDGQIPLRILCVKTLTAICTISSGGSIGRGGPDALIGAGIGSLLTRALSPDNAKVRHSAILVGVAAGIAAIFKAPLGGALFAIEMLATQWLIIEILLPSIVAATTSYGVFTLFEGRMPIFGTIHTAALQQPLLFLGYALLGIIVGTLSLLYPLMLEVVSRLFRAVAKRLPLLSILNPAVGGMAVGVLGMLFPQVIGLGFGWVQFALNGTIGPLLVGFPSGFVQVPILALVLLMLMKLLAITLTLGSGGSGGILGPGFVLGSFIGLAVWFACHAAAPTLITTASLAGFVVAGMSAFMGGIMRAPLACAVIALEMTNSLSFLFPTLLVTLIAWRIAKNHPLLT